MQVTRREMDRRDFCRLGLAGGLAAIAGGRMAWADPLPLPLGIQLYSVRELLPKDFQGTLDKLGQLGFRQVEAAGFYDKSASDFKATLTKAKLTCVSAHYPYAKLAPNVDQIVAFQKELGAPNIVCASPGRRPGGPTSGPMTIEDWKWNAGQFNEIAKKVKAAGFQFAYHNHFTEFQPVGGVVPYEVLLKETDPAVAQPLSRICIVVQSSSPAEQNPWRRCAP